MTETRPSTASRLARILSGDRLFAAALLTWPLLAVPFLLPGASDEFLTIHSQFLLDAILIPVTLAIIVVSVRNAASGVERKFWRLVCTGMIALWLAAYGYWTKGQFALYITNDLLYLGFYMAMALAAMVAPHRRNRDALADTWPGVLGLALALVGLLCYFVLIPGALNAERYATWLPSMYLFLILDVSLIVLYLRLFADADSRRWRAVYGLVAAAFACWGLLDLAESLDWAMVIDLPYTSPLNLLWSLPFVAIIAGARAASSDFGDAVAPDAADESGLRRPMVSHIALVAAFAFPLIHFGFTFAGLLDPALQGAREVVVIVAIVALGATALIERARTHRGQKRERAKREFAEAQLRDSEARYRTLVEHAPDAIVILDAGTGKFVEANLRAQEMFRHSRDELLTLGPVDLSPPRQPDGSESCASAMRHLERVAAGQPTSFDWLHQDSRGTPIHCEVHLVPLPATGRELVRGSIVDVTDKIELRTQLRDSRKLEAIGRLAGGIAHDFNNLLTVITGYSDLAVDTMDLDPEMRRIIDEIRVAGSKAAALTGQLLAFSRRQELALQPLDLNAIVTDLMALLRRLLGEDMTLEADLDTSLPRVLADPAQVEQVIVNLAVNGRDAMPEGGKLTIATSHVQLDEPIHDAAHRVPAGRYGRLAISDTGVGMDEATRERVFEPFFTTKEMGMGTGLGLATVYGIVSQCGGYVTVDSSPGRGSTFAVHFPVATSAMLDTMRTEPAGTVGTDNRSAHGRERVLFVEDEAAIRTLQSQGLEALGYSVVSASNGQQALEMMANDDHGVQVLVTDVVLPGLSGPDLAERILADNPNMKVIFVSGYTDDLIGRKAIFNRRTPFIQKPFSPLDLARKIRDVIGVA